MAEAKRIEKNELCLGFLVYGALPLFCGLMALLIVVMQFVNSRVVFPEEGLPLYRQLSLFHAAFQKPHPTENEAFSMDLLTGEDLPTEMLSVLPSLPEGVFPIVTTTISQGNGLINATEYSADTSVSAAAPPAQGASDAPLVLVYHTHATESFYEPETSPISQLVLGQEKGVYGYYEEGLSPRSEDTEKNMVAVGRAFCDRLSELGIAAVHCETLHDLDYSKAYGNSLKSVNEYLEKYPSIRYIIDLHRDSLVRENGTKLKPTCVIDGENVAQVMLVVGAGSEEVSQKNWRENLAMSARWQTYFNEVDPTFARPVYLRYGRFNQHVGSAAMLLEVGSCGNTLEEAIRAAQYAATALGRMIEKAA